MFKKFIPLIVILALLAGYAGYRAVDAQAGTPATSAVTSLDSAPAAYIAWAQAVENGPMDSATNLPTTADAAHWVPYLYARYGQGCCGLSPAYMNYAQRVPAAVTQTGDPAKVVDSAKPSSDDCRPRLRPRLEAGQPYKARAC